MEIGSVRERILIALLMVKFGQENVDIEIPITEPEIDVLLYQTGVSIKTKTGSGFTGVKVIWTVDWDKVKSFLTSYAPSCDLLFVQINWEKEGGFFFIPLAVQKEIFKEFGRLRSTDPKTNRLDKL